MPAMTASVWKRLVFSMTAGEGSPRLPGVVDDAPGHGARDLADEHRAERAFDDGGAPLVLGGGLGVPGNQVFAGMVFDVSHFPEKERGWHAHSWAT